MAVKAAVIEIDVSDQETSINTRLTTLAIDSADFIQATMLNKQGPNQKAKIIIFYNE